MNFNKTFLLKNTPKYDESKRRQLLHKRADMQYKKILKQLEKAKMNKERFEQKSNK
jgi:hypothetical protein